MTRLAKWSMTVGLLGVLAVLVLQARHDTRTALTGRTGQGTPFVTQLENGRISWFDTTLFAHCGDARWRFNWNAVHGGTPRFEWTGDRLTAHGEGTNQGASFTLDLEADYTPDHGLHGRMRFAMGGCDSGWFSFWARADR